MATEKEEVKASLMMRCPKCGNIHLVEIKVTNLGPGKLVT